MRSPSIVPDAPGDIVSALNMALATIRDMVVYDDELRRWFVADEDDPLFAIVPGLINHVRKLARANNQSEVQGARSADRKRKYDRRKVHRARAYLARRRDPAFAKDSDSDLKMRCGQRLVRDPADADKYLRTLQRSQAVRAIDEGLALIASGRFALESALPGISDKNRETIQF